ncbi:MAG: tetratricopeptide repeat protein, partial [Thermoplasmata archaeon]|nr:tetratricopeptide repeat protein [Thermoplasmata archaeon]
MTRPPKGSDDALDRNLAAAEHAAYAGDYEEALRLYEAALEHDDTDPRAWEGKAHALAQLSRYPEAAACYEQALLRKSSDATNWLERGRALREEGRFEEALDSLREAVRLEPRLLVARLELQEVTADLAWEEQVEDEAPVIEVLGTEERVPPHPTHMPALDASMRGGVTPGSVVLVTGTPGTFKTS